MTSALPVNDEIVGARYRFGIAVAGNVPHDGLAPLLIFRIAKFRVGKSGAAKV